MVKKMLINAVHPEECRVAVVADGTLEELDVQVKNHASTLGNIYKGVINRVEPSLQAAFVDYGATRNGFLSINDVHPSYFPESFEESRRRPRIEGAFKKGDELIVQVNREEIKNKGASLTTNVSIAGRYLVLMPGSDLHGVSRKIEDEKERKKLKDIGQQLKLPENMGFIIRTAGMGRTKTELTRDLNYLLKLWKAIEGLVAEQAAPALLHREQDVVIRSIRDHFTSDIDEILIDDKAVFEQARDFLEQIMPRHKGIVKLYQEKRPIFNKYQLEEQVEQVYRKSIPLKSGGHIVIESTEALVTVDVNSGSATREKGIEETAFRVNMEAAPEIARQLRLRDLGGIVVIDFIDMIGKKHKLDVERAVKAELKKDRAKSKVLRISALGLLELSRQRLKTRLGEGEYMECPACEGNGRIRSPEMTALSVFRKVKSQLIKPDVLEVRATVPAKVAEYLLNNMRSQLVELENAYGGRVCIHTREIVVEHGVSIETMKQETAPEPALEVEHEIQTTEEAAAADEAKPEPEKKKSRSSKRRRKPRRKTSQEQEGVGSDTVAPEEQEAELSVSDDGVQEEEPAESVAQAEVASDTEETSETPADEDPAREPISLRRFLPFS